MSCTRETDGLHDPRPTKRTLVPLAAAASEQRSTTMIGLVVCFFFLYFLVLPCIFCCCYSCCCIRAAERNRRAAAWARSANAPAPLRHPWWSASAELVPPLAVPPVEPLTWRTTTTSVVALAVKKKELRCFPYSASVVVEGGGRTAAGERQLVCAICLEAFVHGATCSEVPACRHFFHRDCIGTWMKNSNGTCPLCRATIAPRSERLLSAAEDMV